VGLPLFGGVDRETGFEVEVADGAFQKRFRKERCLAAWKKVGAALEDGQITWACLDNPKVLRDLGDDGNTDKAYWAVQTANNIAIAALKQAGYDADWLKAKFKWSEKEDNHHVTQPNTLVRQQVLANAHIHGGRFHVSGGGTHLTCNDIFIAAEISSRQKDKDEAEQEKKHRLQIQAAEEKAIAIVEQGKSVDKLTVGNLNALLDWHQVKMPQKSKKEDKLGWWMQILVEGWPPPEYQWWTDVDEQRLLALSTSKIGLTDTCYGRKLKRRKREMETAVDHMSWDD
jgi:hypothetical protein